MIPNSVGVSLFSNVLQLFFFLSCAWCRPWRPWFNVSCNYFWMYLNWGFYLIPVWHLILKGMFLGWNIWYADATTNFVTDSVNLGCHFMARQTPRLGWSLYSFCTWKTWLEYKAERGSIWKWPFSSLSFGKEVNKASQWMENVFLHFPVPLDMRMANYHVLKDWHENLSMEKNLTFPEHYHVSFLISNS